MGTNPRESVCDGFGRSHDHPNLFVIGAPTLPTGGSRTARSPSSRSPCVPRAG